MSQGKFSNPRPYRDEERQIEETFRQLTDKPGAKKAAPPPQSKAVDQNTRVIPPQASTADSVANPAILDPELAELLKDPTPRTMPSQEAFPPSMDGSFPFDLDDSEPEPEPQEDFLDKAMAFFQENRKAVLAIVFAAALLLMVGVGAAFVLGTQDPGEEIIAEYVHVGSLDVGGMTVSEASSALNQYYNLPFANYDMVIDLDIAQITLSPGDTGAKLDTQAAAMAAFEQGQAGSDVSWEPVSVDIHPYLTLDTQYIRTTINSFARDTGSTLTQTTYGLEGLRPELGVEDFDEDAPTQTLVIALGTPGIGFDAAQVYQQVLDAYAACSFLVEVKDIDHVRDPDPVDLQAIYDEYYIAPVDASLDHRNDVVPGSYGYGFDLEKAQQLLDNAEFGEEVRIPMEYIEPEILNADMFFRDILGRCDTHHTDDKNRTVNLRRACEAIDGLVLEPGETFSFNDVVGQRTTAKGYREAPAYFQGELTQILGGGISQVASTLYKAALLADMEIVNRTSHDIAPDYIDLGMDSSISWGSEDLRLRNTSEYPVKIAASVANSRVSIQLLGTESRDYYVELEYEITKTYKPDTQYEDYDFDNEENIKDGDVIRKGITGYQVKTYKSRYDNANGKLLGRDFVATSRYSAVDEIIARVEEPEETTEEETEPETQEPETEPPVTKPTEPKPTQPKPTDPPATEPKPTETKPLETQPKETVPPETDSGEEDAASVTEGTEA